MHYVYSTLTAGMEYTRTEPGGGELPITTAKVYIAGGANVPDKYMRTPDGAVVTPVNDEQLTILQENEVFKLHQKNGFIVVKAKSAEPEVVAADMETRDRSAPLVDGDFEDVPDEEKPKVNTAKTNSRRA